MHSLAGCLHGPARQREPSPRHTSVQGSTGSGPWPGVTTETQCEVEDENPFLPEVRAAVWCPRPDLTGAHKSSALGQKLGGCGGTASPPTSSPEYRTPSPPASAPTPRALGTRMDTHTGFVTARRAGIRTAAGNTHPRGQAPGSSAERARPRLLLQFQPQTAPPRLTRSCQHSRRPAHVRILR